MAQIIYKNMHVYTLHRSNNLDHKIGRPAILLKFKNKYSLIWYATTKIDLKTKENPFILEINNVKGYFYSSGIEKVKTIFLKSKWIDYSTNNAYKLSIDEQKALFLKFASFSLEINPYLKIKELEIKIEEIEKENQKLKQQIYVQALKFKNRNRG